MLTHWRLLCKAVLPALFHLSWATICKQQTGWVFSASISFLCMARVLNAGDKHQLVMTGWLMFSKNKSEKLRIKYFRVVSQGICILAHCVEQTIDM